MVETGGVPPVCDECGGEWVFRAPWWARPSPDPEWGYLVHCERRHFRWVAAELDGEEKTAARARFLGSSELENG